MQAVYRGALPNHGRFDYLPIHSRPDYCWPSGARLAVYLGLNLEHFAFGEGQGARIGPASPEPDVLNHAWREYGNRVGAWRCLEMFDGLAVPSGVLLNSAGATTTSRCRCGHVPGGFGRFRIRRSSTTSR